MTNALRHQEATARTGMIFFLGSWWMMFAGLFFTFLLLKARQNVWPPSGLAPISSAGLLLSTIAVVISSVGVEVKRRRELRLGLVTAAVAGALFVLSQVWVAQQAMAAGFKVEGSPVSAFVALIAVFHLVHAAVGAIALVILALRQAPRALTVGLWANYWHFVGVIWFLIYVLVFPF
jgi:heme/copper-type cytochrome/quinol oxidase subunit 3